MGGIGSASYQQIQHKSDTFKNIMINEGISIVCLAEVNINWSKIPIKENVYNRKDGWFETIRISTGYNQVTASDGLFQIGVTAIVAVDEVSCRVIAIGQELRTLG